MLDKPKLDLKISSFAKFLNSFVLVFFTVSIVHLLIRWPSLPDRVPTHYNIFNEPDAWGAKAFIFIPQMIAIVMWIGLSFLEKYPHLHNYMNLTVDNVEKQYRNSMMMLNLIKNEIVIIFSFFSWNDIHVSLGNESLLGGWEAPIVLTVIFGTILFHMIRSFRLK